MHPFNIGALIITVSIYVLVHSISWEDAKDFFRKIVLNPREFIRSRRK